MIRCHGLLGDPVFDDLERLAGPEHDEVDLPIGCIRRKRKTVPVLGNHPPVSGQPLEHDVAGPGVEVTGKDDGVWPPLLRRTRALAAAA